MSDEFDEGRSLAYDVMATRIDAALAHSVAAGHASPHMEEVLERLRDWAVAASKRRSP